MKKPKRAEVAPQSKMWPYFVKWGSENNVSFDHWEDWLPHWECFYAGVDALLEWQCGRSVESK